MICIEFGGGQEPRKPDYKQCDIRDLPGIDYVCSAWKINNIIEHGTVDKVFSRHFLEHLTFAQSKLMIQAWYDILKPNGVCEIIVPDMLFHIKQWLHPKRKRKINKTKIVTREEQALAGFFGHQRGELTDTWDIHKSGYDFNLISDLMGSYFSVKRFDDKLPKNLYVIGIKK